MIDIKSIYAEYNVPCATEGHKHCRPGWVQTTCPFCEGNPGYHLGFNLREGYFHCWRCGFHHVDEALSALLGIPSGNVRALLEEHSTHVSYIAPEEHRIRQAVRCHLPTECQELGVAHKRYLKKRRFDADKLQALWKLHGTPHYGTYSFRIIAPIYMNHILVSYQGRDITNKSLLRYKACSKEKEVIHHKHLLYGFDDVPGDRVVICEGITDVWRLGPGAVATFGIQYKLAQVQLMTCFVHRYILYDRDPQAQEQAKKLANLLAVFPGETAVLSELPFKDPAEMPQAEANRLMERILKIR